jgi:hypothetical protein
MDGSAVSNVVLDYLLLKLASNSGGKETENLVIDSDPLDLGSCIYTGVVCVVIFEKAPSTKHGQGSSKGKSPFGIVRRTSKNRDTGSEFFRDVEIGWYNLSHCESTKIKGSVQKDQ